MRLRFQSRRMNRAVSALATVVTVLLLPLAVPVAVALDFTHRRKMRAIILGSKCPNCGAQLDIESIISADARWNEIVKGIHAQHEVNARIRIVRDLHAICNVCKTELRYRSQNRDLVVRTE